VSELLFQIALGAWLVVLPWTTSYFEGVNTRHRLALGATDRNAPGLALAIVALVLGIGGGRWRWVSICSRGCECAAAAVAMRVARPAATAALAGVVGLALWIFSPSTVW